VRRFAQSASAASILPAYPGIKIRRSRIRRSRLRHLRS